MSKILIAEEETPCRDALALNLRAAGLEVLTASSTVESLQQANDQPPDLLILDLKLPYLDGLSLCRLLRRCGKVPIIMLTSQSSDLPQVAGLECSSDDYVVRPINPGELLTRVRNLLQHNPEEASRKTLGVASGAASGATSVATSVATTVLQSGDLLLDLITRRATRGPRPLKLTQKEFDLLAELIRYRGTVLSRDRLLTRVWGRNHIENSHTVDVHIRWLREKIEEAPSAPTRLLTVRGAGYRFEQ